MGIARSTNFQKISAGQARCRIWAIFRASICMPEAQSWIEKHARILVFLRDIVDVQDDVLGEVVGFIQPFLHLLPLAAVCQFFQATAKRNQEFFAMSMVPIIAYRSPQSSENRVEC